jgi:hypothetical protein
MVERSLAFQRGGLAVLHVGYIHLPKSGTVVGGQCVEWNVPGNARGDSSEGILFSGPHPTSLRCNKVFIYGASVSCPLNLWVVEFPLRGSYTLKLATPDGKFAGYKSSSFSKPNYLCFGGPISMTAASQNNPILFMDMYCLSYKVSFDSSPYDLNGLTGKAISISQAEPYCYCLATKTQFYALSYLQPTEVPAWV